MKKILVIGSGAREHIIATKLADSPQKPHIVYYGSHKNPGIEAIAGDGKVGKLDDVSSIIDYTKQTNPDWVFIGPDNPIGEGLVDILEAEGFRCFAPKKSLARLESSKGFTRNLLEKHSIPGNPRFQVFECKRDEDEKAKGTCLGIKKQQIQEWIEELDEEYVVKYDALLGGKGVKLSGEHLKTKEEGIAYAVECIQQCGRVVIEEKFVGEEFSLLSFVDGKTIIPLPAVQDHKRAYEGDTGPNTGGMGTYSDADHSLPFLNKTDREAATQITEQTMKALEKECGEPFIGIMYGGFIVTRNGTKVIEFNARFGDPEVMNLLTLLESDLVEICEAALDQRLSQITVSSKKQSTVCKYVVPEGYPDQPVRGEEILIKPMPEGVSFYLGSVESQEGKLLMGSSRAVAIVAAADTIAEAEQLVEKGVSCVSGKVFHRTDIGTEKLLQKKILRMKKIR